METHIVVRLQEEGFHQWLDAFDEADFLKHRHRHVFHIEATKEVFDDDREIEIILFKQRIKDYLHVKYGSPCEFKGMSCEMIAKELVEEFELNSCAVLEDNENGAVVHK